MAGPAGDRSRRSLRAEINVTPLVDVVLVLLIIFMVITPLLSRGKPVQLPAASMAQRASESVEAIVLTITPDRQLWLETRAIDQANLEAELSARAAASSGRQLLIKADSSLSMRDLRPLLRRLKAAGLAQIAFGVVEPPRAKAAP
jgi:biopolymer transport protein TolR